MYCKKAALTLQSLKLSSILLFFDKKRETFYEFYITQAQMHRGILIIRSVSFVTVTV